jgi:two-component system phosphate regulon sensor histidine kinase PhoR
MDKTSLRKKIITTYLLLIILPMLLTGLIVSRVMNSYFRSRIESNLLSEAKIVRQVIEPNLVQQERFDLDAYIDKVSSEIETRITVIDAFGTVLADSQQNPEQMENHKNRTEIKAALAGRIGRTIRYSTTLERDLLYVAVPVYNNGSIVAVVRTALPIVAVDQSLRRIGWAVGITTILFMLAAVILAIRFAKTITAPIEEMTALAKNISQGNFGKEINIYSKDEIGQLARTFSIMSKRLSVTIADLASEKNRINAILESIVDGVIAVDSRTKILFANQAAGKIFSVDTDRIVGNFFLEGIRNLELNEIIYKIIREGGSHQTEMEIGNSRTYYVQANPITGNDLGVTGVVITMRDITEFKALQQMKTDFVANVSHELRTPLTSIKGFTETLLDGAMQDAKNGERFLQIIHEETDRLIRLVKNLLDLSQLETNQIPLNLEPVSIIEIIKKAFYILQHKAEENMVTFACHLRDDLPKVMGDFQRLQQVFINLLDNAFEFTKDGSVTIEGNVSGNFLEIKIIDNGIGIPKKDLPRLFERFYRVEKGRARRTGGTGLGLAIVKHIIALHHGSIHVTSKEGAGTTFHVLLPITQGEGNFQG